MPRYRRNYVPGGTYFFTCVTYKRQAILTTERGRQSLREAITLVQSSHPFEILAIVLIPDHWHTVWALPPGDARYPLRWMRIKEEFTKQWLDRGGLELMQTESRRKHRQRGIWHKRYWEHTVRSEEELDRCVDYIHWNPKKHALVTNVADWQWSSFHRFVRAGHYEPDWGRNDPCPGWNDPEWGELM